MSRALLEDAALYRSEKPHEREIQLPNGTVGKFYIRDLRDHEVTSYFASLKDEAAAKVGAGQEADEDDPNALAKNTLIAAGLVEPDGTQSVTVELVAKLKYAVRQRLLLAVLDANDLVDRTKAKN